MWWRALGVAAVLLCVGVAGGYAVAEHDQEEPVHGRAVDPLPAESPSDPVAPSPTYAADPSDPPLPVSGIATEPRELRLYPNGPGVKVDVPVGWRMNQVTDSQYNFVDPDNPLSTYLLRVQIQRGQNISIPAAMQGRIAALETSDAEGGDVQDFKVTSQTSDTLYATYTDRETGRLRYTQERWVSFDGGNTAYASVAVTGRALDQPGMGALLTRAASSLRELKAKPASPAGGSESAPAS